MISENIQILFCGFDLCIKLISVAVGKFVLSCSKLLYLQLWQKTNQSLMVQLYFEISHICAVKYQQLWLENKKVCCLVGHSNLLQIKAQIF